MILSSDCTSVSVSAEVGSSMMMRRPSIESARAISTSCCSATESAETGVIGVDGQPDARDDLSRLFAHPAPVDEAEGARRGAADEDVLRDRQRRDERELLVDGDDALALGVVGIERLELGAAEHDAAAASADARPTES